jgi:hypothetical protein
MSGYNNRDYFPRTAALRELRQFRAGKMLGPLTWLASSYLDEQVNMDTQVCPELMTYPHYSLPEDQLVQASPIRNAKGEVTGWAPWRETEQVVNG